MRLEMEIISRKEAKERGLKRYYTNEPCMRGHLSERQVSGGCLECKRILTNKSNELANPNLVIKRFRKSKDLISNRLAKNRGEITYYSVTPCKNNHLSLRVTATRNCFDCAKEQKKERYHNNKELYREKGIIYREKNKEAIRASKIKYYNENREYIREFEKKRYQENKENNKERARVYYKENRETVLAYSKRYREINKDLLIEKGIEYRRENKERLAITCKKWRENNKVKIAETNKKWRLKNREKRLEYASTRDAKKRSLTPPIHLQDRQAIRKLYKSAKELGELTGRKFHIDHIWPLHLGGVHHPCNLQILESTTNLRKHASHDGVSGVSYEDFMLAVSAYA